MERLKPNSTCFFCDHFYHFDPDTDRCALDEHEVYFDTPRCESFSEGKAGAEADHQ